MRRFAFLMALAVILGSPMSTRADFAISVQSENVTVGSNGLSGPLVVNVYITSTSAGGNDLNNFGYQLAITPLVAPSGQYLQFVTSGQETFNQLPSGYVFNGTSDGVINSPTSPVGTVGGASNSTFTGGDITTADDYNGNTHIALNQPGVLLTQFLVTGGPGSLTPVGGDSFSIALVPLSGTDTTFTDFQSSDSSGNDTNIAYTSTAGIIRFTSSAPAVPLPTSILLMGSGLAMTGIRVGFRKRISR